MEPPEAADFCCFLSADAVLGWLEKRRSRALRAAVLAILLLLTSNAAIFTLVREVASGSPKYGYQLFDTNEVAAADYIKENTEPDAIFLTDDNHDNAVAVLSGRNIVCGSGSYLYYHGLDYGYQRQCAERMLTDAEAFERYKDEFSVDFVYMGYYERAMNGSIDPYLREKYPAVFTAEGITIYFVR